MQETLEERYEISEVEAFYSCKEGHIKNEGSCLVDEVEYVPKPPPLYIVDRILTKSLMKKNAMLQYTFNMRLCPREKYMAFMNPSFYDQGCRSRYGATSLFKLNALKKSVTCSLIDKNPLVLKVIDTNIALRFIDFSQSDDSLTVQIVSPTVNIISSPNDDVRVKALASPSNRDLALEAGSTF